MPLVEGVSVGAQSTAVLEFHEFFEAEYRRLARALYLLTDDTGEADDLAQEALVRVYERWDRVRAMDSPTGYLYRTAMNLNRSRLRKLAARARRMVGVGPESTRDPASTVEALDQVDRALRALSAGQREALVLVEWIGLSAEEAGRALGIKAVSVRVRLSRAKASVRKSVEDADE